MKVLKTVFFLFFCSCSATFAGDLSDAGCEPEVFSSVTVEGALPIPVAVDCEREYVFSSSGINKTFIPLKSGYVFIIKKMGLMNFSKRPVDMELKIHLPGYGEVNIEAEVKKSTGDEAVLLIGETETPEGLLQWSIAMKVNENEILFHVEMELVEFLFGDELITI